LGIAASFATVLGLAGVIDIAPHRELVRPPGVISEERFLENCMRCAACVRACPVQGIGVAHVSDGFLNAGTPFMTGYCMVFKGLQNPTLQKVAAWKSNARVHGEEMRCYDCADACPSGALQRVDADKLRLGIAAVKKDHCLAWRNSTCGYPCMNVCPFDAISIEANSTGPVVDATKCVGCGMCDYDCLARETTGFTGISVQTIQT
jgi:ferredoxin-type protein NapG